MLTKYLTLTQGLYLHMLSQLINEKLVFYPLFRRGNQGTWCSSTLSQIVHLYNDRARIRTYSNSHDFKPVFLGSHVAICVTSGKLLNLYVPQYTSEKRIITVLLSLDAVKGNKHKKLRTMPAYNKCSKNVCYY